MNGCCWRYELRGTLKEYYELLKEVLETDTRKRETEKNLTIYDD